MKSKCFYFAFMIFLSNQAIVQACGWTYQHDIFPLGLFNDKIVAVDVDAHSYWIDEFGNKTGWIIDFTLTNYNSDNNRSGIFKISNVIFEKTDFFNSVYPFIEAAFRCMKQSNKFVTFNSFYKCSYTQAVDKGGTYSAIIENKLINKTSVPVFYPDNFLKESIWYEDSMTMEKFLHWNDSDKINFGLALGDPELLIFISGNTKVLVITQGKGDNMNEDDYPVIPDKKLYLIRTRKVTGCLWDKVTHHHGVSFDYIKILPG